MDEELSATVAGCVAAHRRLKATIAPVDDETVGRASRLPGWTVGHVLTHLARNADSHVHARSSHGPRSSCERPAIESEKAFPRSAATRGR